MANSCLTDDVVWEIVLYVAITIDQHVFHSGKKNPSYQGTHVELNPNTHVYWGGETMHGVRLGFSSVVLIMITDINVRVFENFRVYPTNKNLTF